MSMSSDLGAKPDSESRSEVQDMPRSEVSKDTEIKENVNSESADDMPDSDLSEKSKSLPEPIRVGKDMPRLPPINMTELASILQGPNMPSQKLMKEVTEKIRLKNDESGSDDGSVTSGGGVGIRGILDCILEVSLFHQDSEDESDGEGDEIFVRELPCRFCKKVFGSTMNLKTHVLMTHSQEDPSVLNVMNQAREAGRKEKLSPGARSKSMEGREKESSGRTRKRSSAGQQESKVSKEDLSSRDKQVRSRHSSKEQSTKTSGKMDEKPRGSSTASTAPDSSKSIVTSSQQTTTQISHQKDDAKMCDLISTVVNPSESSEKPTHSQKEDTTSLSSSSSSKSTKRKSSKISSSISDISSPTKKAKRSQSKPVESKGKGDIQLRRSSRNK